MHIYRQLVYGHLQRMNKQEEEGEGEESDEGEVGGLFKVLKKVSQDFIKVKRSF